jgi:hypothetical protein
MYIFDVKSKEDLDTFFKNNYIPYENYPKEYPCKILFTICTRTNSIYGIEFIYKDSRHDGLTTFKRYPDD